MADNSFNYSELFAFGDYSAKLQEAMKPLISMSQRLQEMTEPINKMTQNIETIARPLMWRKRTPSSRTSPSAAPTSAA